MARVNELQRLIASCSPGDRVELEVIRYGDAADDSGAASAEAATAPVETRRRAGRPRPAVPRAARASQVAPLTRELARQLGFPQPGGVVITEVEPFGAAGRAVSSAGLQDRFEVDRKTVEDVAAVRAR